MSRIWRRPVHIHTEEKNMERVVIDATGRFAGDPDRLDRLMPLELPNNAVELFCDERPRKGTEGEVRAVFCPSINQLPFVLMKEGGNPLERAKSYWHDEPSNHGGVDHRRGRTYAQLFIKAVERDRPAGRRVGAAPCYLEAIFAAMIDDAFERRRKGGKGSRTTLTSAMAGFLRELADHICKPSLSSEEVPGS
jgi:hypothetical protein